MPPPIRGLRQQARRFVARFQNWQNTRSARLTPFPLRKTRAETPQQSQRGPRSEPTSWTTEDLLGPKDQATLKGDSKFGTILLLAPIILVAPLPRFPLGH